MKDVEYIERDEDDEEFDEFGRKKKKRNEGVQQVEIGEIYLNLLIIFIRKKKMMNRWRILVKMKRRKK